MPQTDGKNGSEYPQITDNKQHSLLEMPDFAISENEFKKNPGTECDFILVSDGIGEICSVSVFGASWSDGLFPC